MTIVLAFALCLLPQTTAVDRKPASSAGFRASFDRGLKALEEKRLDDARAAFTEARRLQPRNAAVAFHLGQIAAARGEFAQAIASYREAISLDPRQTQYHFRLAALHGQLQRFHDAEQVLEALLRARPSQAEALLMLGRVAQEEGDHKKAETHLRAYLKRRPQSAEGLWRLAASLLTRDDSAAAEPLLRRALRLDPDSGGAHYNLGVLLARRSDDAGALSHLSSAVRLMPNNHLAFYQLGKTQARMERVDEAEKSFRRALEISPDYADAQYGLAGVLRRLGRTEEADAGIAEYERVSAARQAEQERARRLSSYHAEVRDLLASDRADQAAQVLHDILQLDPNNDLARYRLAQIAFLRRDYDEALRQIRTALELKDFDPAYHLLEGMTRERVGSEDEAAAAYRRVLTLAPYGEAHAALARLALQKDDVPTAVQHLQQAVALEPRDADLRIAFADALQRAGRAAESRRQRDAAATLRP